MNETLDLSFQTMNDLKLNSVETFLENERNSNKKESWSKLNKNEKKKKIIDFANRYISENNLSVQDHKSLIIYLNNLLDKRMLIKIKDICYDKEKEVITQIPALMYNHVSKKFTLKRHDNRVSTTKSLNLGKTRKNLKEKIDDLERE